MFVVRSKRGKPVARFATKREAEVFIRVRLARRPGAARNPAASPVTKDWLTRVGTADVTESGVVFRTHRPVSFRFAHNTERAPKIVGDLFGQSIEPAGFYCLHVAGDAPASRGWISGTMHFNRPLVLTRNYDGNIYGSTGWKARLSAVSGGKKKKALSSWLLRQGFDGIVTVFGGDTSEIVALHPQASIR